MRSFQAGTRLLLLLIVAMLAAGAKAADEVLRVMTFNVRYATANDRENNWGKRKELLLATIRTFDPDLLGTQEVLAMQVDFLAESLKDYTLVGVGRDDGKRRGEFSSLLFKTARFELLDSGTFWLSETPDKPGSKSWDSSLPRVATWARLRDRQSAGREICFLNTHWDHQGDRARAESGRMIRQWLAEHAPNSSAIVTGDFNVTDSHKGFQALVADDGSGPALVDAYKLVHKTSQPDEATFHGFSGRVTGRRIDHILVTPNLTATAAQIDHTNQDGKYPSDHFPVTAVLRAKD